MSAKLDAYIQKLEATEMISVKHESRGKRVYLTFSKKVPHEPGVYVIYDCAKDAKKPKPFYVGEAGDLLGRLTFLFRCNSIENPHPCQKRYAEVVGKKISQITFEGFCKRFRVKFDSTKKYGGRLEIEDALKRKYGTNCAAFYKKLFSEEFN